MGGIGDGICLPANESFEVARLFAVGASQRGGSLLRPCYTDRHFETEPNLLISRGWFLRYFSK